MRKEKRTRTDMREDNKTKTWRRQTDWVQIAVGQVGQFCVRSVLMKTKTKKEPVPLPPTKQINEEGQTRALNVSNEGAVPVHLEDTHTEASRTYTSTPIHQREIRCYNVCAAI